MRMMTMAFVATVLVAGLAKASTVTYQSADGGGFYYVPQFNPAMGGLDSVTVSYSGAKPLDGHWQISSVPGALQYSFNGASGIAPVSLRLPCATVAGSGSVSLHASYPYGNGQSGEAGGSVTFAVQASLSPAGFVGTGTLWGDFGAGGTLTGSGTALVADGHGGYVQQAVKM